MPAKPAFTLTVSCACPCVLPGGSAGDNNDYSPNGIPPIPVEVLALIGADPAWASFQFASGVAEIAPDVNITQPGVYLQVCCAARVCSKREPLPGVAVLARAQSLTDAPELPRAVSSLPLLSDLPMSALPCPSSTGRFSRPCPLSGTTSLRTQAALCSAG